MKNHVFIWNSSNLLRLALVLLASVHAPKAIAQSATQTPEQSAVRDKDTAAKGEQPSGAEATSGKSTAVSSSPATSTSATPSDATRGDKPAVSGSPVDFQQKITEFRQFMKECRDLIIDYHLTTTSSSARTARQDFVAKVDKGRVLYSQLIKAAIEKYSASPENEKPLGEFLYGVLTRGCAEDRYEGLLDVGLALSKAGFKAEKLDQFIAQTAIALHEYDLAKPYLERVFNPQRPIDPEKNKEAVWLFGYYQNIELLKQFWQEELASQASDKAGEPLPKVRILTSKGEIVIELFENQAPETVGNFVKLVEDGFYNGLSFHRVLEHFMAQTGCPNGDGSGDGGYTIFGELRKPGARKFLRGTVGMALANGPDTGGSQFFLCMLPQPQLNDGYVAFGRILSGMEVLSDLVRADKSSSEKSKTEPNAPPDEILSAEVISKRNHPYVPNIASRTAK